MTMLDPDHPLFELLCRDKRYNYDAYRFVFDALEYSRKLDMGSEYYADDAEEEDEPERHVTGQELCEAMRLYAHEQYGYMAKCVLNSWGIKSTSDFGEIVFNLIKIEQMRKTPHDRREDFDDVFGFDEGFQHSFQFSPLDPSEERDY